MSDLPTAATCRGCRRELRGSPFHAGGTAYHPETGKPVLAQHFGGWVCSAECDRKVFREMKAQNVWGTTEEQLMASADRRHSQI